MKSRLPADRVVRPPAQKKKGRRSGPIGFRQNSFEPDALEAEVQRQLGKSRAADGVLNRAAVAAGRNQVSG